MDIVVLEDFYFENMNYMLHFMFNKKNLVSFVCLIINSKLKNISSITRA